jgi:hypothetical protein
VKTIKQPEACITLSVQRNASVGTVKVNFQHFSGWWVLKIVIDNTLGLGDLFNDNELTVQP